MSISLFYYIHTLIKTEIISFITYFLIHILWVLVAAIEILAACRQLRNAFLSRYTQRAENKRVLITFSPTLQAVSQTHQSKYSIDGYNSRRIRQDNLHMM